MKKICGMTVVLILAAALAGCGGSDTAGPAAPPTAPAAAKGYTCPMHPEVASDKPGKCPKCQMNLEPKK